ncbi:MAG: LegC family aminotransferase [Desulfovibrionaceae bacterium]|nr:LegC family aminotransferase [Desulfovibrionaceae bacterium]
MHCSQFEEIIAFIKGLYPGETPVPLHAPRFLGNEKKYLADCIDTTFVSYVGAYVTRLEDMTREYTGAARAVALVNGTSALHMALHAMGVGEGDEVITQPLTFVATCNAVRHTGAWPVFVDVDKKSLGLCPQALAAWLTENTRRSSDGKIYNRTSGRRVALCLPMHSFGQLARMDEIMAVCAEFGIPVLEDAAEALGSFLGERHAGTMGRAGILSYNGNKPVTCGGGGMVITNDEELAARIRHLSTTAKQPHPYLFNHDEVGYNLRLPNLNAAVGCAQMENFSDVLANKRELALIYGEFFRTLGIPCIEERPGCRANYWLNGIFADSRSQRDRFLEFSAENGVQCRPVWTLMPRLPMYSDCACGPVPNALWLEERIISLPSSYRFPA